MRLHQLNKANYTASIERDITYSITSSDKVILIEDAIIRLLSRSDTLLNNICHNNTAIYALSSDLEAYGVTLPPYITSITDMEWIELANECSHQIAW